MGDNLRVNGNRLSWGSTSVKIDGQLFTGITSIKFSDSRERTLGYGMGQHHAPVARTRGKYAVEPVVIKFYAESAEKLRQQLAASSPSGTSFGEHEFPIVIQNYEPGTDPITIELLRCCYVKGTTDQEEGPEGLLEEVEFSCMQIVRNGRVLFDNSVGAP